MQNNDLISREALIEDLSYCAPELFFDKDFLLHKIMRQPVINAEPVKRGKWSRNLIGSLTIQDGFLKTCFKCSECNGINLVRSNFCPNCGARMEVDE